MSYWKKHYKAGLALLLLILFLILGIADWAFSYPVRFNDSQGRSITIERMPLKIVSLVPSITEIVFKIGAGDTVKGVTYYDIYPQSTSGIEIVGGFFSPSPGRINDIGPEIIFVSKLHKGLMKKFAIKGYALINLEANSVSDIFYNIQILGKIFNKEGKAKGLVRDMKDQFEIIAKKISTIPEAKRKRVVRLMAWDKVMVPGDDSFQNEYIRLAGGIPPKLDKNGDIVSITKEEWIRFNPEIIYGCGGDRETVKKLIGSPGWRDVEAIKEGRIFYFPCNLTCRASVNAGDFIMWLSSRIYPDEFVKKENLIMKNQQHISRNIEVNLDYVKNAFVLNGSIYDFPNKALVIDFTEPLSLISTLDGKRNGIETVGNNNFSPPFWEIGHKIGLKKITEYICRFTARSKKKSSFLFTGVNIDNMAIKREVFKDMEVYALVTAGVKSNSVRMSADEGLFYELGTINIILLPNLQLTERAMQRAIISATEAKTAALQDLDIRSKYSPLYNQATGTGTDNIIVVEGKGRKIDNSGGHSKMGELIARAVYGAVLEGIYKQNGITARRNIFQRLEERGITVFGLVDLVGLKSPEDKRRLTVALEGVLLEQRYASFVKASFSISDDYEKGLISDLTNYESFCRQIAENIAGNNIKVMDKIIKDGSMPLIPLMAFNAILNGLLQKEKPLQ